MRLCLLLCGAAAAAPTLATCLRRGRTGRGCGAASIGEAGAAHIFIGAPTEASRHTFPACSVVARLLAALPRRRWQGRRGRRLLERRRPRRLATTPVQLRYNLARAEKVIFLCISLPEEVSNGHGCAPRRLQGCLASATHFQPGHLAVAVEIQGNEQPSLVGCGARQQRH